MNTLAIRKKLEEIKALVEIYNEIESNTELSLMKKEVAKERLITRLAETKHILQSQQP